MKIKEKHKIVVFLFSVLILIISLFSYWTLKKEQIKIIVNDKVIVQEGPLKGMESAICKIDRHKRRAWLELFMFGRKQSVEIGIEILEKKQR